MKTLCVRVSRATGHLVALQFKGEFDAEDVSSALRVIQVNVDETTSADRFINRLANVSDALKAKGIICEVITEN